MYINLDKINFLNSQRRRTFLLILDILIICLSIWLSFWLRLGIDTNKRILECLWLFPSTIICGILIYIFKGQYRGLTRHLKSKALYQITGRNFLIILVISLISVMGELTMPPRSSLILLWILLSVFVGGFRFILRDALLKKTCCIKNPPLLARNLYTSINPPFLSQNIIQNLLDNSLDSM